MIIFKEKLNTVQLFAFRVIFHAFVVICNNFSKLTFPKFLSGTLSVSNFWYPDQD